MEQYTFKGKAYTLKNAANIALGDIVCINGITGYFDALLAEKTLLIDEAGKEHLVSRSEIKSVFLLSQLITSNKTSINVEELTKRD